MTAIVIWRIEELCEHLNKNILQESDLIYNNIKILCLSKNWISISKVYRLNTSDNNKDSSCLSYLG